MEREHSLLNASSANIWLTCTRAPRFAEKFEKSSSVYADEGTLCHAIATDLLLYRLDRIGRKDYLKQLAKHRSHKLYQSEMDGFAEAFADYCIGIYDQHKTKGWAVIWVELKVDYSHVAPEGYGHLDVSIVAANTIHVIDFKYGKNYVSAIANPQLSLYAIGVIEAATHFDELSNVTLHIHQPRIDNIDTYSNTVEEFTRWGNTTVKKAADLAFQGKGDFRPGVHCRYCAARPKCKASTDYHLALGKFEKELPYEMSDEDIAEVLAIGESLVQWYESVKEYARDAARKGKKFSGYKLVAGKSIRKYVEGKEVEISSRLRKEGYSTQQITKNQLLGIVEMEKLLSPGKFIKVLGKYVIKPPGIPTLVPETDKRSAITGTEGAKEAFKNLKIK